MLKHLLPLFIACLLTACTEDYNLVGTEREQGGTPIYLSTNIAVRGTSTAFDPQAAADSRIETLRLIISESHTGTIVYNQLTRGAQLVAEQYNQPQGTALRWTKPFRILPGDYDFWFIANEGNSWYAPADGERNNQNIEKLYYQNIFDRLRVGSSIARIFDGQFFGDAGAQPLAHLDAFPFAENIGDRFRGEQPTLSTARGVFMPMSAVYRNVAVNSTRNGKGASEDDPQHFVADGDELVRLVRTMAKVTVNIERAAYNAENASGQIVPQWLHLPFTGDFGLTAYNVPRYWTFFQSPFFNHPLDPKADSHYFYDGLEPKNPYGMGDAPASSAASGDVASANSNGAPSPATRYAMAHIMRPRGGDEAAQALAPMLLSASERSASSTDLRTFSYTFYVPEMLLPAHRFDGDVSGGTAGDLAKALSIGVTKAGDALQHDAGRTYLPISATHAGQWPLGSSAVFVEGMQQQPLFSIGQESFSDQAPMMSERKAFVLPNSEDYSRFSIVRNTHYVYNIREKDRLQVDVRIAPWDEEQDKGRTYVFKDFAIWVEDPTFSNPEQRTRIRVLNTVEGSFDDHHFLVLTLLDNTLSEDNWQSFKPRTDDAWNDEELVDPAERYNRTATFTDYVEDDERKNILGINVLPKGESVGNVMAVVGENSFGPTATNPQHLAVQEFTIDWSKTQGNDRPQQGKAFIRIQWMEGNNYDQNNETLYSRQAAAFIFPLPSNWREQIISPTAAPARALHGISSSSLSKRHRP